MSEATRQPVDFDIATRLEGSEGRFGAVLTDDWQLWGPSGGYLAAIALRAAGEISELPRPVSFFCHFLKAPEYGEIEVRAEFERRGRRSESIGVTMLQDGSPTMRALVRTSADAPGHEHQTPELDGVPRPEDLETFTWRESGVDRPTYTYWNNFERKPVDSLAGGASRVPIAREWVRFIPSGKFENAFLDAARPLVLLDTYGYLAAKRLYPEGDLFAPNLDTSAWFHNIPAQSEWLLIDHSNPIARDGVLFVNGNVWADDGSLVASGSAQLVQLG